MWLEFALISCDHCFRSSNEVVDALAKPSFRSRSSEVWEESIPDFIYPFIVKDISIIWEIKSFSCQKKRVCHHKHGSSCSSAHKVLAVKNEREATSITICEVFLFTTETSNPFYHLSWCGEVVSTSAHSAIHTPIFHGISSFRFPSKHLPPAAPNLPQMFGWTARSLIGHENVI